MLLHGVGVRCLCLPPRTTHVVAVVVDEASQILVEVLTGCGAVVEYLTGCGAMHLARPLGLPTPMLHTKCTWVSGVHGSEGATQQERGKSHTVAASCRATGDMAATLTGSYEYACRCTARTTARTTVRPTGTCQSHTHTHTHLATCPKAYLRGLTLFTRSYGVFHSRQNAARASCSASRSAANRNSGQYG